LEIGNWKLEFGIGETPVDTPFMASEVSEFVKRTALGNSEFRIQNSEFGIRNSEIAKLENWK
jgi:hypothetical protein